MPELGCPAGLTPTPPPPLGSLPELARPASAALLLPLLTGVSGFQGIQGGPRQSWVALTPRRHPLSQGILTARNRSPRERRQWSPIKTHRPQHSQALWEPSGALEDRATLPFSEAWAVGHLSLSLAPFGHPGGEDTHKHQPPRPHAPHLHGHHPVTPSPLSTNSQGETVGASEGPAGTSNAGPDWAKEGVVQAGVCPQELRNVQVGDNLLYPPPAQVHCLRVKPRGSDFH